MGNTPNIHKGGYDNGSFVKIIGVDTDVQERLTTSNNTESDNILSETDKGNGTVSRVEIPFDGFKYLTTHLKVVSGSAQDTVTVTLWGTNDKRATTLADTYWVDITQDEWLTASVVTNNATFEHIYIIDLPLVLNRLMIKVVYAYSGGIAADNFVDIYIKKSS